MAARELPPVMHAAGASEVPALEYTNAGTCPCGRPIRVAAKHRGRRPRLCGRCKQTRRALTFIRAGARILEQLRDPDYQGEVAGG